MRLKDVPMDHNCTYDFAYLISCDYSNPNGDPDFDNRPRTNAETDCGEITSECIKRKIRDRVLFVNQYVPRENCDIFIRTDKALNTKLNEAADDLGLTNKKGKSKKAGDDATADEKNKKDKSALINEYMRNHYFDVRMFGAVMNTGDNPAGNVTGALQMTEVTSPDPVYISTFTHTRAAKTKESDQESKEGGVFPRKPLVTFGLYKGAGRYNAHDGVENGVTDEDLRLFFESLVTMYDNDLSACRTGLAVEKLVIFKHNDILSTGTLKRYKDRLVTEGTFTGEYPQSMEDYNISIDMDNMPETVEVYDVDLF